MKRSQSKKKAEKAGGGAEKTPPAAAPVAPLKPRRGLFYALLVMFAVWVGALVTVYVTTVYPLRHGADRSKSDLSERGF